MSTIRVGTRGSTLALEQAKRVVEALRRIDPSTAFNVQVIDSAGDANPDAALDALGIGVFTSAIERALLEKRIDIAVHSLKDLPTIDSPGLTVVPVLEREDARDVLISRYRKKFMDLAENSRIGTSSPRRIAQLKFGRKDVIFLPIRGNIETRIVKSEGPDYDGVVLAAAGLRRLGKDEWITEHLSVHVCTPAPGQGAIAAQARSEDREILALLRSASHRPTTAAVLAERELLRSAGSGCQLPIGAHATVEGSTLILFATVTPLDGSKSYRVEVSGSTEDPEIAGKAAYAELMSQGAEQLLHGARHEHR